jgi:hypothetical protein
MEIYADAAGLDGNRNVAFGSGGADNTLAIFPVGHRRGFSSGVGGSGRGLFLRSAPGGGNVALKLGVAIVGAEGDRTPQDHPGNTGAGENEDERGELTEQRNTS